MKAAIKTEATLTISVIIPVYNVAEYLQRCLDSVIKQTYKNLQIIIVDDGSTDGSGALCDKIARTDKRISVFHTKNGGLSAARNFGVKQATGSYLAFVDSDDWLAEDMYEYLLDLLLKEQADVAFVDYQIAADINQEILNPVQKIAIYDSKNILTYYLKTNEYGVWMRLYKRQLFNEDMFDEGHIYEDVVFGFRVLQKSTKIVVSNQKKYFYFVNPDGISYRPMSQKDFDLFYSGDLLVKAAQEQGGDELIKLAQTKRQRACFTLLIRMALTGTDSELDEREVAKQLQQELRQNYWFLMRSTMPPNRKLLMTLACVSYGLVKKMAGVYEQH
ncbi:hypothetical protein FACS1894104_1530 [Actinomycetota bacterium]|nr:hypothetical protein FACS1894104_1530 [Actinomycetota bacterium]